MKNSIPTVSRTTYLPTGPLDRLEADGHDYRDVHGYHRGFLVIGVILLAAWSPVIMLVVRAVTKWAPLTRSRRRSRS